MNKELLELLAFPLAVLAIFVIGFIVLSVNSRRKKRLCTVQATVQTKKIKRAFTNKLTKAGVSTGNWFEYYAVFSLENGKSKELQLPQEIYDSINDGDKGQLSFKGYYFISFDKDNCFFV